MAIVSAIAYLSTVHWVLPFPRDSTTLIVGRDFLNLWMYGVAATEPDPGRFYAVYVAAFAQRPGFPGQSADQWISWISGDEDFRPHWTLLASLTGTDGADVDAGFIASEATGWIWQVGVVPQAWGRGVGASLIAEVVRRMRSAGETTPREPTGAGASGTTCRAALRSASAPSPVPELRTARVNPVAPSLDPARL